MLEEVLCHLKNWFVLPDGIHTGHWQIKNGKLELPFLQKGQLFRICGSVRNDGLYHYSDALRLQDENFAGNIWALAVPTAVCKLAAEIETWQQQQSAPSPYLSESFGGYSYTRAANTQGGTAGWRQVFATQLNPWRKLRDTPAVPQPWRGDVQMFDSAYLWR